MHPTRALLAGILLVGLLHPATVMAADPLAELTSLEPDALGGNRGGTDVTEDLIIQGNQTNQVAANDGVIGVGGHATKTNGEIYAATVTGNHGITAVMQNTGDLVNMNNATSVNVYLR